MAGVVWAAFCFAVGLIPPYLAQEPVCGEPYTDWWIECTYGEEMDLTPTIEDEAQTTISQQRELQP